MTGADLIKWIQDNHAENMHVMASDEYEWYISKASIKDFVDYDDRVETVICLE